MGQNTPMTNSTYHKDKEPPSATNCELRGCSNQWEPWAEIREPEGLCHREECLPCDAGECADGTEYCSCILSTNKINLANKRVE